MKSKWHILGLLCILLLIIPTSCSVQNKESSPAISCPEFSMDGYITYGIHIPKDDKMAYVVAIPKETFDPQVGIGSANVELFKWTKNKDHYENPQRLEVPEDFDIKYGVTFSTQGDKIYFSSINSAFFGNDSVNMAVANLTDTKLSDIKALDALNTSNNQFVLDVDDNQNLIYLSNISSCYDQLFYAAYENNAYTQGIVMPEKVNLEQQPTFCATLSPDGKTLISARASYHNQPSSFLMLASTKTEEGWTQLQPFDLPVNTLTEDNLFPSISGDGTTLYFIRMPQFANNNVTADEQVENMAQGVVYKMPLEKANSLIFDDSTLTASSNDLKNNFSLKLRDKGDETQKAGIYYELFVRAFADSDGDGIGDFNGVTSKLDYLKDLGIDGIWLMPINESPSYHGYDVIDYYTLNSDYGTEEDFKRLLDEAHKRDIKIIMDFVINHTSSSHPWFKSACFSPNSPYRDYYRFVDPSDTENYNKDDLSPWNSEVWHPMKNLYYYGVFYDGMPDLNYNNKAVREEIKKAATKWLEMGVDGFRLDAAIHIYGDHEHKGSDQLSSNIQWWNEFARACEKVNPNVYLVGEAWQNDNPFADYVQPFDTKFNFTLQDNLVYAVKNKLAVTTSGEDLAQSIATLRQTYDEVDTKYLDGIFIGNHDQDRVMSTVTLPERAKLLAHIYLTLPGNPYLYYGEELGMLGAKPDEQIRLDFKWTNDSSQAPNTNWLYTMYDQENTINQDVASLEEQEKDPASMYNTYKTVINLRKSHTALSAGDYTPLTLSEKSVLGYMRASSDEQLIILHNLGTKPITLTLSDIPELSSLNTSDCLVYTSYEETNLTASQLTLPTYATVVLKK